MKKALKFIGIAVVVVLVAGQFIRYPTTNPQTDPTRTVEARMHVDAEVNKILQRACTDCHSNDTKWPWYAHVAPVSWLVGSDVKDGRADLNLSDWARFDQKRALRRVGQMCSEVRKGDMPPWYYVLMHAPAKLTQADKDTLCAWADAEKARLSSTASAEAVR
jgi:cytochrome c551/c552